MPVAGCGGPSSGSGRARSAPRSSAAASQCDKSPWDGGCVSINGIPMVGLFHGKSFKIKWRQPPYVYVIVCLCIPCICVVMILRPSVPTKQKMEGGGGRDGEERRKMMRWCYHMMRSWKSAADIKTSLQPSNSSKAVYCTHFRLQESCSKFGPFWTTRIFPWQPEVAEREQKSSGSPYFFSGQVT